jgi:hypothetical protein
MLLHVRVGALVATLLSATPAMAATVFSDNFNGENGGVGQLNYTAFANWNVVSGSVDLIGNGFFDFLPGNGLYVDMDGSTGAAGSIQTKATFAPGSYTLSFDLAGSERGPDGNVTVTFGPLSQTIDLPSSTGFTLETFNVTLSSPSEITFTSNIPGNVGALLDNVALTTGGTRAIDVPEPGFTGTAWRRTGGHRRIRTAPSQLGYT